MVGSITVSGGSGRVKDIFMVKEKGTGKEAEGKLEQTGLTLVLTRAEIKQNNETEN